jgi:hypothetical protein
MDKAIGMRILPLQSAPPDPTAKTDRITQVQSTSQSLQSCSFRAVADDFKNESPALVAHYFQRFQEGISPLGRN